MRYMCLIYSSGDESSMTPEEREKMFEEFGAYTQAARESGKMVSGEPLQPPSDATTVRVRNGKRTITDGPFAETKEWLGGFYICDVDTLDEALDWAAKCPGARYGSIEVRPIMVIPGSESGSPVESTAR